MKFIPIYRGIIMINPHYPDCDYSILNQNGEKLYDRPNRHYEEHDKRGCAQYINEGKRCARPITGLSCRVNDITFCSYHWKDIYTREDWNPCLCRCLNKRCKENKIDVGEVNSVLHIAGREISPVELCQKLGVWYDELCFHSNIIRAQKNKERAERSRLEAMRLTRARGYINDEYVVLVTGSSSSEEDDMMSVEELPTREDLGFIDNGSMESEQGSYADSSESDYSDTDDDYYIPKKYMKPIDMYELHTDDKFNDSDSEE